MRRLAVFIATATLVATAASAANAETLTETIVGGTLSVTASNVTFNDVTLTGANQTATASAATPWIAVDARGTGAAWSVAIAASTPTSAAGSVETTARTIDVSNLAVSAGTLTAGVGADPTTNLTGATALTLSNSAQTLLSSSGTNKGTYTLTPSFSLTVPANAYRSNYSGTVGSSSLNPYTTTLTVTIS